MSQAQVKSRRDIKYHGKKGNLWSNRLCRNGVTLQFWVLQCPIKMRVFIKMRAAFLASILPRVMKEGDSKEGSSHFDEKLSI